METNRNISKKISSVLLAAILLVCMVFTNTSENVYAAEAASVNFTAQANQTFMLAQKKVAVTPGLAAEYGYTNDASYIGSNEISALDALVAAHMEYYGKAFTKETATQYLEMKPSSYGGQYLAKAFGISNSSLTFLVNGQTPLLPDKEGWGATIDQAKINSNDQIEVFFYQDMTNYSDQYTWFEQNGKRVDNLEVTAGDNISLTLLGHGLMGSNVGAAIKNARITSVDANGKQNNLDQVLTNENGVATFQFKQAGTYYVSAVSTEENVYFASPYVKVVVKEPVVTPQVTATPQATVTPQATATPQATVTPQATTTPVTYVTLKNPTKKGYLFKGWYKDAAYKNRVKKVKKSEYGKIKLYQKWQKVTVKKVTLKSVKNNKKKSAKATWKKVSNANGYQVVYSTNKKFKKNVKKTTVTKTTKQISKLSKKKTYYVKVRAYRFDSKKKKVYGSYSKVVKVTIKK